MQVSARCSLFAGALAVLPYLSASVTVPAIGPATTTPAFLTVNTPTTVTVTVQITDPTLIPDSVNLLRLGAAPGMRHAISPAPSTILGKLHDDGRDGDVAAGDHIYSLLVSFTEPTAGQVVLQVSAAFRGLLMRVRSPVLTINVCKPGGCPVEYPLKVSSNGRYLVDQRNLPFMIVGDSPQALIGNLSLADASMYVADRQTRGFNALWINLLCAAYTACASSGQTFDNIAPFTSGSSPSDYDLSTPNESYFARVDAMLSLAASYGMVVFLDPIETGGWLVTLQNNGISKAYNYGIYLGNRYKSVPNLIWLNGNDFQSWQTATDDALVLAVANGIRSVDSNHIHTIELNYEVSSSLDDSNWAPIVSLNAAYTYYPTYAEVLHAYNQSSSTPAFLVEAHYELESVGGVGETGTPQILRRQEYWTMLSGATGQLYGNHYTWTFVPGWQSNLDTPGAAQLGYMKTLFASLPWYMLVPDQSHTVVTGGFGTFSDSGPLGTNDYVTAASTPDGSVIIAYLPSGGTISVDMTKLGRPAWAQWYDPSSGSCQQIAVSPFRNTGTQQFTPAGNNEAGDADWVLVLDTSTHRNQCGPGNGGKR